MEENKNPNRVAETVFGFVFFMLFGALFDRLIIWSIVTNTASMIFIAPFVGTIAGLIIKKSMALAFLLGIFFYPILALADMNLASALTLEIGLGMIGGFLGKFFFLLMAEEEERVKSADKTRFASQKSKEEENKNKMILP